VLSVIQAVHDDVEPEIWTQSLNFYINRKEIFFLLPTKMWLVLGAHHGELLHLLNKKLKEVKASAIW